jgi:hypothetical protein
VAETLTLRGNNRRAAVEVVHEDDEWTMRGGDEVQDAFHVGLHQVQKAEAPRVARIGYKLVEALLQLGTEQALASAEDIRLVHQDGQGSRGRLADEGESSEGARASGASVPPPNTAADIFAAIARSRITGRGVLLVPKGKR